MNTKPKMRLFSILLCLVMLVGLVPITAYAATTIDSADIVIAHPVHLANPETFLQVYGNCQVYTIYNSDGYKNGLRWKDVSTSKVMGATDTFIGGKQYELSVCLLSKSGYAFSASATKITINTDPASLSVQNNGNQAQATIRFTADNLYINSVEITGLEPPKVGNTPDYSLITAENVYTTRNENWTDMTGGESMLNTMQFKTGHAYKFGFFVLPNPGYEFPHNVQVYVNGKRATVTSNAGRELSAVVEFPALEDNTPQHTHTPSAWRTTGIYHYKVCTTCGDFLEQEDHKGGKATCAEKGKCTVCGYKYIDVNETHTPDTSKWVIRGDMYHYHACKLCGAHCDIGAHVAGPAGTPNTAVVCKDCGYVITPAKNHKHNLTKVTKTDATCTEPGNVEYYTCDGCSDFFADSEGKNKITDTVIAPMGHKISDDWKYDKNNHWRTCTVCNEVLTETQMAHQMENGKCTTCSFDGTIPDNEPSDPTETTPDSTVPQQQDKDNGGMPWWAWLLIAASAVAIGIVVGFLVLKQKKKE